MKRPLRLIVTSALLALFASASVVLAAVPFPSQPLDLPPGAISYDGETVTEKSSMPFDPNIVAAVIGVSGLLAGSIITILATYFMRWMDVRREDRRDAYVLDKNRREKEFALKHETYRDFLATLAGLESLGPKNLEAFRKKFAEAEINLDLASSAEVRKAKDLLKTSLLAAAEASFKSGAFTFDPAYAESRDNLIGTMRADIDIFRQ